MKSPLLLPLYLLAVFLVFLLGFTAVSMLWMWTEWAPYGLKLAARAVLERGVSLVSACVPIALLPSLLVTALRVARNPVSRPFSLLLPLVTAFCILYFGPLGLDAIPAAAPAAPPQGIAAYLREGVFATDGGTLANRTVVRADLVVPGEGGAVMKDIVVAHSGGDAPRLSWFGDGRATLEGEEIVVRSAGTSGAEALATLPAHPLYADLVKPSPGTIRFLDELGALNRELYAPVDQTSSVLIAAGVTVFFWFSCFLLRTTRWPLLSVVLLGLLWRGALAAIRFLAEVVRPGLTDLLSGEGLGSGLAAQTVSLTLLAAGLVFLVVDLVGTKFDFWKKEIEG